MCLDTISSCNVLRLNSNAQPRNETMWNASLKMGCCTWSSNSYAAVTCHGPTIRPMKASRDPRAGPGFHPTKKSLPVRGQVIAIVVQGHGGSGLSLLTCGMVNMGCTSALDVRCLARTVSGLASPLRVYSSTKCDGGRDTPQFESYLSWRAWGVPAAILGGVQTTR